jgi:hypothetical protein
MVAAVFAFARPALAAEVRLQWDRPVTGAPAAGFLVYWDTTAGGERFRYDAGNSTSCTIPGLDEGRTYYFVAKSYTSAGVESVCSNQVTYRIPEIDSDEDGIADHAEIEVYGTYSQNPDTDMDGIADGNEAAYWGTLWQADADGDGLPNLLDPDSDNDGWLDGAEVAAGTDPADSSVFPEPPSVWIEAVCLFRVEQEGDYVLWARVLSSHKSQNDLYVSVDGAGYALWNVPVQES